MDDDGEELVQPVRVLGLVARVGQPELKREDDAVIQLDVAAEILLIFEALEVQREHVGQRLDLEALLGLLQAAARVAVELVALAERLGRRELAKAGRDGRVLLNVDREVKEGLIAGGSLKGREESVRDRGEK